jgi:sucrose-phosphate synthase
MYILLINIHGLVRSHDIEFGRDADTGGQTRYILDLARTLGKTSGVERVDLVTRLLKEKTVSSDYAEPEEHIEGCAKIIRLSAGGTKYIRKEKLWSSLDEFTDRLINYLRHQDRLPDVVHGHYADAGYVAEQVAGAFGLPLVFSGHSLGRGKLKFLLDMGWTEDKADEKYSIRKRIKIEEEVLSRADLVIASTSYEQKALYGLYENKDHPKYQVIPPGLDLESFFPYYDYELPGNQISAEQKQAHMRMKNQLRRFHFEPDKPLILTLCRPDARKNIDRLIEIYGEDRELQALANLAIFAGIREDISVMGEEEKEVLTEILMAMDKYDLYGKMAIPKNHDPGTDVPEMYRIAALSGGVFVSSAYLENFGLTFIEASAAGLPFIATDKGGPVDIVANMGSGRLVDIDNTEQFTNTIKTLLTDQEQWTDLSERGINKTREIYSWENHVESYLKALKEFPVPRIAHRRDPEQDPVGLRFRSLSNVLIVDIDDTLVGDPDSAEKLARIIREKRPVLGFGIATGRHLESAQRALKESGIPSPDVWITSVGSEIFYGKEAQPDKGWKSHISRNWKPDAIRETLEDFPFLSLQSDEGSQSSYKISYNLDDANPSKDPIPKIHEALSARKLWYSLIHSHGNLVDILPYRASKGKAIRYLSTKWNVPLEHMLTAGNSGNDRDMLTGSLRGIVVSNHERELNSLKKTPHVFFAESSHAGGIIDGMIHYGVIDGN